MRASLVGRRGRLRAMSLRVCRRATEDPRVWFQRGEGHAALVSLLRHVWDNIGREPLESMLGIERVT